MADDNALFWFLLLNIMSIIWKLFRTNNYLCANCVVHSRSSLITYARRCHSRPREKFRSYLLKRYLEYLRTYENAVEKKFPNAVRMYRGFLIGVKEFKEDSICLFQVFKKIGLTGKSTLTRRELEVYHKMPKDLIKVSPVLLITALPFGGVIFPIAYMFPRTLLSHHFWSLQQRSEFSMIEHKEKLTHFRPVFRSLQAQLRSVKSQPEHKSWSSVLGLIGSGVHPSAELLLECRHLFEDKPYHLSSLSSYHIRHLLGVHRMHRGWRRRTRLAERARLLQNMDNALRKEGGPESLSADELRWACYFRGLNPVNVSQAESSIWLEDWLKISSNVSGNSWSLLLHAPILLGYNQPSNWLLLHDTRT